MKRSLRTVALATATSALLLAAPGVATAADRPAAAPAAAECRGNVPGTVALPTGSLPEGIAAGKGTTFYAGSRADGSIVRGDLRTGRSSVLVPGVPGRIAVGMVYDARTDRLWVAGGATGAVTVYDGGTGAELGRWVVPGSGFLNDVEITRDAAYVTDSSVQRLVVVPLGRRGALPAADGARTLPITGDLQYGPGFNANGIRALGDGALVVTQSSTGDLFRVDPATGASDRLEISGRDLTAGDGLVLRGRTLYVVYGFSTDSAAVVRLAADGRSGAVVGEVGDPDLDRPTTGILSAGALYLVNGRFANPSPTTADYQVVRVEVR
ncbi:superoxide dismutase [Kineococcus sp. R8]|uniref:superoxide dismutase n=1 Tax=Kineococcus siccus TaxID=2696567 RepID=UPI00141258AE|nr:superoxide dismutase [Kineococcus siccus]NAZ80763.1 superoxide dismutase [Kineococcus siccus]